MRTLRHENKINEAPNALDAESDFDNFHEGDEAPIRAAVWVLGSLGYEPTRRRLTTVRINCSMRGTECSLSSSPPGAG